MRLVYWLVLLKLPDIVHLFLAPAAGLPFQELQIQMSVWAHYTKCSKTNIVATSYLCLNQIMLVITNICQLEAAYVMPQIISKRRKLMEILITKCVLLENNIVHPVSSTWPLSNYQAIHT